MVWPLFDLLVFVLFLFGLFVGISALVGMVGAMIGSWLARKSNRKRPVTTGQ